MNGTATHVNNAQMFLQRKSYLEECYFTWSMTPVYDDNRQIAGIYSKQAFLFCVRGAHQLMYNCRMMPIETVPNFDNTLAVVTERRLKLLRDASQALTIETKPVELYRRICKVTSKNPIDLPLLVFYDSSAADDEREMSEDSSDKLFEQSQFDATSQHDGGIGNNEINIGNSSTHPSGCDNAEKPQDDASMEGESATEHSGGMHLHVPAGQSPSLSPTPRSPVASRAQQQSITSVRGRNNNDEDMRGQSDDKHAATEGDEGGLVVDPINKPDLNANLPPQQQHKAKPLSTFERAAYTGCAYDSKLFPPTIPPPAGEEDEINIATHPIFLQALRKVQTTHQHVVLQEEDIKPFTEYLDKTILGDQITTVVILP